MFFDDDDQEVEEVEDESFRLITAVGFVSFPKSLIHYRSNLGLNNSDIVCILVMMSYIQGPSATYLWEPEGSISEELGVSLEKFRNKVEKLRKLGLLLVDTYKGGCVYDFSPMYCKINDLLLLVKKYTIDSVVEYTRLKRPDLTSEEFTYTESKKRSEHRTVMNALDAPYRDPIGVEVCLNNKEAPLVDYTVEFNHIGEESGFSTTSMKMILILTRLRMLSKTGAMKVQEEELIRAQCIEHELIWAENYEDRDFKKEQEEISEKKAEKKEIYFIDAEKDNGYTNIDLNSKAYILSKILN